MCAPFHVGLVAVHNGGLASPNNPGLDGGGKSADSPLANRLKQPVMPATLKPMGEIFGARAALGSLVDVINLPLAHALITVWIGRG